MSVILTTLSLATKGSVLVATLFHGAVNTFGIVNPSAGASLRGWTNAVSYGAAAIILYTLTRKGAERSTSDRPPGEEGGVV